MWHIPTCDDSIKIEYSVKTEPVTDSPSARIADSPSARITDSPSAKIADSPSTDLSWSSIQSPPITSTPFIRRPARLTPYSRRNQNEEIRQKQEIQLKEEIQYLKDRLLSYKKSVQYLEMENSHLKQEVQTSQETITREVSNFKTMVDVSLSNKLKFDQMEIKCINLDIDNKHLRDANEDLKNE